nr:MAG TPA: Spore germination protein [Caudoviricetes sp.]
MFTHVMRVRGFFDDEPTTKKLYFNLSRREIFEFIRRYDNVKSFEQMIKAVTENEDRYQMVKFIDDLVGSSYGERQGDRFVKNEVIKEAFLNSPEYEAFFNELMEKPQVVKAFYDGIMPANVIKSVMNDPKYKELAEEAKKAEIDAI